MVAEINGLGRPGADDAGDERVRDLRAAPPGLSLHSNPGQSCYDALQMMHSSLSIVDSANCFTPIRTKQTGLEWCSRDDGHASGIAVPKTGTYGSKRVVD
eukprot:1932439-Rhodomonas_salina.1